MPKEKTKYQKFAGKLISAIQKVWGEELGVSDSARVTEEMIGRAHKLLKAQSIENARTLLGGRSVRQYLGETWLYRHPHIRDLVDELDLMISENEM